ncbi:MAG: SGNH/GDSL hydrolase family protein [bacterium]
MIVLIKKQDTILFQGDSITDCGRSREDESNLGEGYAMMAAARFNASYPEKEVTFLNRGISGNRVKDLKNRWQEDCLDLKPDIISILIGINDCWRRYDSNDPTSVEDFKEGYHYILTEIKKNLKAEIILGEPFLLPVKKEQKRWREDLDPKIQAVRELAREFDTLYLPLDGLFAQAAVKRKPSFWAADGVHPTPAGHAFIASKWLEIVEKE